MAYNKETKLYEGYIYKITNIKNGKLYIGQTTRTLKKRFSEHLANAFKYKYKSYLYTSIRKYGAENFRIDIIEKVYKKSKEELSSCLFELEKEYITKFDTFENGYNSTFGDKGLGTSLDKPVYQYDIENGLLINKFPSIEYAEQKTGVTSISQTCNGRQNTAGGYLWSFELYDVHPNAGHKPCHHSVKIDQYSLNREFIAMYDSEADAERILGINNICYALNGTQKSVGGYLWCRHGEEPPYPSDYSKCVDKYNFQGELVASYETSMEAERLTGINYVGIIKCCKGKINHMGYFVWRYKGEPYDKYPIKIKYKKINCYTCDDEFINTFDSIACLIQFIGVNNRSKINACLRGELESVYGYKLFYIDDENQPDKSKIFKYKTVA